MFSKVFVKLRLTGIFTFLILYISATSATPIAQPREAQKNDAIHARAYNPHQCKQPYNWLRRECMGAGNPRAWQDVCAYFDYNLYHPATYDNKPGSCPDGTYCLDTFDVDGNRFINCVAGTEGTGKRKPDDPQIGTSDSKKARYQLSNTQFEYSVTLDHDMTNASVAAVIKSDDDDFIIAPNNVIVGNIHGKRKEVCHGDKSSPTKARECYPNGTYDLRKGDIIDYTWGMTNAQEGQLVYGVMPVT